MNEQERYLFDLQGFLVVPDALSETDVGELNTLMNAKIQTDVPADAASHHFLNELLEWGPAYLNLIDNPRVLLAA